MPNKYGDRSNSESYQGYYNALEPVHTYYIVTAEDHFSASKAACAWFGDSKCAITSAAGRKNGSPPQIVLKKAPLCHPFPRLDWNSFRRNSDDLISVSKA